MQQDVDVVVFLLLSYCLLVLCALARAPESRRINGRAIKISMRIATWKLIAQRSIQVRNHQPVLPAAATAFYKNSSLTVAASPLDKIYIQIGFEKPVVAIMAIICCIILLGTFFFDSVLCVLQLLCVCRVSLYPYSYICCECLCVWPGLCIIPKPVRT